MVIGYVKFRAPEFESMLGINEVAAGLIGLSVSRKGDGLGVRAATGAKLASGAGVASAGALGGVTIVAGAGALGVSATWAKTGAKGVNIIKKANSTAVSLVNTIRWRTNILFIINFLNYTNFK
jgi:hypothetical protein